MKIAFREPCTLKLGQRVEIAIDGKIRAQRSPRSESEPTPCNEPEGWVTGFEPAIPRSTISGSDDVTCNSDNTLRIADSEFAHPVPTDTRHSDPELREIIDAWDTLPESVRASLLMSVRGGAKGRRKMRECTDWCDACGDTIATGRTRLEVVIGVGPVQWPIDVGTGRPTIDLCSGCRDDPVGYLAGRKAGMGLPTSDRIHAGDAM